MSRPISLGTLFMSVFLLVCVGAPSHALTISGVTATLNVGDTGYQNSSFWGDYESDSAVSVTNIGGSTAEAVGAFVLAKTRYAQYVWADNTSGTTTVDASSDYRVVMQITPDDAATVYDLQIDTTRLGALTLVDDSTFYSCCYSSATIGSVTGYVDGTADGALAMGSLTSNQSPTNQVINQTSSTTLVGLSGAYTLVLDFNWTAQAFSNNDEGAVRLGLENATGGVSADDYPGPGARIAADDGHFVEVTATVTDVIPEPSTALLLGLGLAGLTARRRSAF